MSAGEIHTASIYLFFTGYLFILPVCLLSLHFTATMYFPVIKMAEGMWTSDLHNPPSPPPPQPPPHPPTPGRKQLSVLWESFLLDVYSVFLQEN